MSERRITVKNESNLPEVGVEVNLQIVDGKIEAVTVGEGENAIRIVKGNGYNEELKITKIDPGKEVDKWFITGKLLGLTDYEDGPFDEEYKAQNALEALLHEKHINGDHGLEVEKREITEYSDKIGG